MTNMRKMASAQILATLILLLGLPGRDCDGHSAQFHVWRDVRESDQFIPHLTVAKTFKFSDDGVSVVSMTSFEDFNQLKIMKVCPVNACFNNGTCYVHNGQPTCKCREGFWGDNCEEGKPKVTTTASPTTGWAHWTEWGLCSTTCDVGRQFRTRVCLDADPSVNCVGESMEWQNCIDPNGPIDCVPTPQEWDFNQWGYWGYCSAKCGLGERFRTRTCSKPWLATAACEGRTSHAMLCWAGKCPAIDPETGNPCEDWEGEYTACNTWKQQGLCYKINAVQRKCRKTCELCKP